MILVGQYDSPYVRRVAVSLQLLGVPFERAPISTFRDLGRMREVNPTLRVPALILDDGDTLTDSGLILDWLDGEVGPERALMPRPGPARRHCARIMALAITANDKAKDVIYELRLRPPEKCHAPWVDRCRSQLDAALMALNAERPTPYLLGERLTQADVTVTTMLSFVRGVIPDAVAPGRWPNLDRLSATCEALPAFAACLPGPDERPPDA